MSHRPREQQTTLPKHGKSPAKVQTELAAAQEGDADWRAGVLQSYVYAVGDDVVDVARDAYAQYYPTNALITKAFPSLKQLESDIIAMAANLLHAPEPIGVMTTGGTESNLSAVLSAREWAREHRPEITVPEIVAPFSAHPSFDKAAHLFGLKVLRTPLTDELTADVSRLEDAITDHTVLIVASAPNDTHGIVDPIPDIGKIARKHGLLFHVDACVGGFFLPFLEKLNGGEPIPTWDFRVPEVTSVSADLHKHGYTTKGASVILYSTAQLKSYNIFDFDEWPTGRYSSATLVGTRPGGVVAAAWAVMNYLGEDGYCRIASKTMEITRELTNGIEEIPGLFIWGQPPMNKFGYGSHDLDILAVAEGMEQRGWVINLQRTPPGINMHLYPIHEKTIRPYLNDLADVTRAVARGEIVRSAKEFKYN